ncbi:MAG: Bug family tripartite tricarboxylate transporter substrate binding protein [Burkholderiales bacterium]
MNRLGIFLCAALAATSAFAQYPAKPVRLVIGLPAGSAADALARILAQGLGESLGQPVLVENKPGAEMAIAAEAVRDAAADGHTIAMFEFSSMVGTPLLNKHVTFDSRKDFAPISLVGRMSMSLSVNPTSPVKSLRELIDYARANPGKLNYASVGAVDTLLAGMLMKTTNTSMTRVNYKGPVQSLQDLMAGRIDVAINPLGAQVELAKNGRLRMLAVFGASRDADVPDVPTMTESRVPEVSFDGLWFGLFGPAKMPAERINRLAQEVDQLLKRPDMREKLALRSLKPESSTPDALGTLLKADFERWSRIATELGLAAM